MNMPKLRFKGFPNYKTLTLDNVAPLQRGFDLPISNIVDGEYPVVFSNGALKKHNEAKVSGPGVVTGRSGTIGNVHFIDKDFWPHNTSLWVINFHGNAPKFIYYLYANFDLARFGTGSGVPTLNRNDVHKQFVTIPSDIDEQKKIASFLTAVDQKISFLKKQHELLLKYKRGVMRKIFSQEIRFKDMGNKDFPGWVEHTLGDICEPRQHKTISGTHLLPSGYPVFGANGLIGYYDSYNHELETVAVTCRGATCGEVTLVPAKSWITGNSMSLDNVNTKENNHKFIYYAVINRGFKDVISGSAQPQIVGSAIKSVKLTMPKIEEQAKIAKFLSSIDDRISLAQSQITLTKKYKQGLLQQMFI